MSTLFPNFLIIGANKGGTSSFYVYLSQHPEIFMSEIKEPMFFVHYKNERPRNEKVESKEPEWNKWKPINDLEEYKKMFIVPPGTKAAGEASTAYLANPECAKKIFEFNQKIKIIAILRNPVSRAFSNYLMYVQIGHESKKFTTVMNEELEGRRGYLPQGRHYLKLGYYADSLAEYYKTFGKENVKIYLMEELKEKPEWLFRDAFEFLGVDPGFRPDISRKHNVNEKVMHTNAIKRLLVRAAKSKKYSKFVPAFIKESVNRELKLDEKCREVLRKLYREDILKVQALTEKDLSAWLK